MNPQDVWRSLKARMLLEAQKYLLHRFILHLFIEWDESFELYDRAVNDDDGSIVSFWVALKIV